MSEAAHAGWVAGLRNLRPRRWDAISAVVVALLVLPEIHPRHCGPASVAFDLAFAVPLGALVLMLPELSLPPLQPARTPKRPISAIRVNNLFIVGVRLSKTPKRTSKIIWGVSALPSLRKICLSSDVSPPAPGRRSSPPALEHKFSLFFKHPT